MWYFSTQVFDGNRDGNTVVYHDLNPPISARYIRFRPTLWFSWPSMRVELFGCPQGTLKGLQFIKVRAETQVKRTHLILIIHTA